MCRDAETVFQKSLSGVSPDLLVLGGGMAGLAAAARAVEAGASVTVVEKAPQPGGSAALSAGIVWTAPGHETMRSVVPGGDPELSRRLVDGFAPAVEWVRSHGVFVSERWEGQMGFGSAHRVDMAGLFEAWRGRIEASGEILTSTAARRLLVDGGGRVAGALVTGAGGAREVRAGAVLLATGGFQGDRELRKTLLGWDADLMPVRSNPGSVGDGYRMGREAGAAASGCLGGFYGHLVPSPLPELRQEHFLPLTQYWSNHAVLVNMLGRRFADESLGDEVSNQALLRQPGARGVLLCDHRVRTTYAAAEPYPHGQAVDRIAAAEAAGGRVARAGTLDALVEAVSGWGVVRRSLCDTLDAYAAAAGGADVALDAPLPAHPEPPREPPYYAVEVQPAITFPFGGLAVDSGGRALDRDGRPVPGLFAAGADAGGLQDRRYVGGLVLGLVFGPLAAEAALGVAGGGGGR
jgi:succinate dehydrogenase/fumarate reductase flavoprotein subunit